MSKEQLIEISAILQESVQCAMEKVCLFVTECALILIKLHEIVLTLTFREHFGSNIRTSM
jgi:hypothetical protein